MGLTGLADENGQYKQLPNLDANGIPLLDDAAV